MTTTMKARETVYAGIKMRSRLEAGFAAWLDTCDNPRWEYEPCAFGSRAGQYLPDFKVHDVLDVTDSGQMRTAYVEVKPNHPDGLNLHSTIRLQPEGTPNLAALGRRMATIWTSEPDALLLLAWPRLALGGESVALQLRNTEGSCGYYRFFPTAWMCGPSGGLAIGIPTAGPWPDGYWNVD